MSDAPPPSLPPRAALREALRSDRRALARLHARIERAARGGRPHDRDLARLVEGLERSVQRRRERAERLPRARVLPELPICAHGEEIAAALRTHQVVVVCGETGSGKSTQLPKILLGLGYGTDGFIGHTQPRRIAARSLARRLAAELDSPLGQAVGFKVRFTDRTSPSSYVKFMTDGVLLAETRADRDLERYDALVIDEAHERSLNIDFLLGYLQRLLPRRPELRVVVTSATIDPERFAAHFAAGGQPAPIIEVSGRTYPVETLWRPPAPDPSTGEPDLERAVGDALDELARRGPGDVLVFLPTQRDITDLARALRGRRLPGGPFEVLPLYARLPTSEQQKLFEPAPHRRVVLATNVAESAVTVPGVRYVVDGGTARISRYSARARIQRLPIEPISRASADQRAGRCGRLGPGVAVRLYAEDDYASREAFTQPEIQRSNLASVVLQMASLGLGRVEDFPFLDPPKKGLVREGERTLRELGALDEAGRLTELGRRLARLPVDPRLGRMILAGAEEGCLSELLVIAAALETGDVRERPAGREEEADRIHAAFDDGDSDLLSFLRLWDVLAGLGPSLPRGALQRLCREHVLSARRCREWVDVHAQLVELAREIGLAPGPRRDDRDAIHRAVLAGLLSNLAMRTGKYVYTGTDGTELFLWPGSTLFERKPKWIVAAEIVETGKRYARLAARIDPRHAEALAPWLVERSWRDPRWDRGSGHVVATERVALYGLPIVPRRTGRYEGVDPLLSRELFIRHALVDGELDTSAPFLAHNLSLVNQLAALEAKTRRRDLLVDLSARYDFYDRRLPRDVVGAATFHHWRKHAERRDPAVLFMTRADLLRSARAVPAEDAYPDALRVGDRSLPLQYRFEPGAADDGVTLRVPVEALEQLSPERLEWLVPGRLREKVVALVRSLPKPLRRLLVPIPERADEVVERIEFGRGSLLAAVAAVLQRHAGEPIPVEAFDVRRVPDELRMRIEVVDEQGGVLAAGRDLSAVRARLGRTTERAVGELTDPRWQREGITGWDFGELPESVTVERDGLAVVAYPALVDPGTAGAADPPGVRLCLRGRRDVALRETRAGVRRLVGLAIASDVRRALGRHPAWGRLRRCDGLLTTGSSLEERLVELVAEHAFLDDDVVRDAGAFEALLEVGRRRLPGVLEEVLARLSAMVEPLRAARAALDAARARPWPEAIADVEQHLDGLLTERFPADVPWDWLPHVPRYLAAVVRRLERLAIRGRDKDAGLAAQIEPWTSRWVELRARGGGAENGAAADLDSLRWMLEEYRVSVFAQDLGTAVRVSPKRLAELCARVEQRLG